MSNIEEIKQQFLAGCEKRFRETYSFLNGKKVWIYGSGMYGRFLAKALVEYGCVARSDIQAFINDFESGFAVDGIPVKKLGECSFPIPNSIVVVGIENNRTVIERLMKQKITYFSDTTAGMANMSIPLMYARFGRSSWPIGDLLARIERYHTLGMGKKREEMESFYEDGESLSVLKNRLAFYETGQTEWLESLPIENEEYFSEKLMELGANEFYLDVGAYTGDTVLAFVDYLKGDYKKILAFEPDEGSFRSLKKNTDGLVNIELVEAATGNQNGEVTFSDGLGVGSAISNAGTKKVRLLRLDDFMKESPTLVKMDIEGAELDTLKGMERIIKKHRPKLIVCVYHKVEDLYEIPKYLKELVPEYRFKLRQHEASIYETVLYAEV